MKKILTTPLAIATIFVLFGSSVAIGSIFLGGGASGGNLQKDLIGHWKFDGNTKDATPYGNNGTLNGDAAVTASDRKGKANSAVALDGTGDYVSASPADPTYELTLSAWFYPEASAGAVVWRGHCDGIGYDASSVAMSIKRADNSSATVGVSSSNLTLDAWNFVAATVNLNTLEAKIYVNSASATEELSADWLSEGVPTQTFIANNFRVGSESTACFGSSDFTGSIDDVRFYHRALSAAEIAALQDSYNPNVNVADTQKGLVGHWKLNGNAKDATPYGNDGTVTGATLTTDRKGQSDMAYEFDGSENRIEISDSDNWPNGTEFSLSLWAKWDGAPGNTGLMGQSEGGGSTLKWGLFWNVISASKFTVHMQNPAGTTANVHWDWIPSADTWYHIAVTRSSSSWNLYIDSVATGGTQTQATETPNVGTSLFLGRDGENFAKLNGMLDDVRVYNRALSTAEVKAIYDSYDPVLSVSTLQKGLVGNWKMDGNAKDATPYENNGTVTDATLTTDRKGQTDKAYRFDGDGDYIDIPNSNSIEMLGWTEFSVSFWINTSGATDHKRYINKLVGSPLRGFNIDNQDPGVVGGLRFEVLDDSGTSESITSSTAIDADAWTHVVVTFKAATASTGHKIYKNGSLLKQEGTSIASVGDNSGAGIRIARNFSTGTNYATGSFDDVRLYDRELSAAEAKALYESYQ